MTDNVLPLFAPTPYVAGSDTSRARAEHEDDITQPGTHSIATARRMMLLEHLRGAGPRGMTWRELADTTGLHHGQVSGALSVMHKHDVIRMASTTRNRCHAYVHPNFWPDVLSAGATFIEPAQTLAGRQKAATDDVLEALRQFINTGLRLGDVVDALRILDSITD